MDVLIMMVRENLEELPRGDLPDGYRLCTAAQFGDPAPVWADVVTRSFDDLQWDAATVRDKFMSKPQYDPEGVFFVMHGDDAVSTAFAWVDDPTETSCGRVHWVGTVHEHRKKGLAGTVVIAVLRRLRERGFDSAFLETHPPLLPAIRLYFSVGFEPCPRSDEEAAAWEEVMAKLDC